MVLCLPGVFCHQTFNKKVVFLHDLNHICGPKQSAQRGMSCALKALKNRQKMPFLTIARFLFRTRALLFLAQQYKETFFS